MTTQKQSPAQKANRKTQTPSPPAPNTPAATGQGSIAPPALIEGDAISPGELTAAPPPAAPPLPVRRVEIKARAKSFLRRLSPDQVKEFWEWLLKNSISEVRRRVAAPPPLGFGMIVHETTLRRIKAMAFAFEADEQLATNAMTADCLRETIDDHRVDFASVTAELLLSKTFAFARLDQPLEALQRLTSNFVKLRELELKARRFDLQRGHPARGSAPNRHHVELTVVPRGRPTQPNPQLPPSEPEP
jgi:hypothetical protein